MCNDKKQLELFDESFSDSSQGCQDLPNPVDAIGTAIIPGMQTEEWTMENCRKLKELSKNLKYGPTGSFRKENNH
jgi:hypothetical protein